MPHEWGGTGEGEYVGKHRKKGCGSQLALIPVVATVLWFLFRKGRA